MEYTISDRLKFLFRAFNLRKRNLRQSNRIKGCIRLCDCRSDCRKCRLFILPANATAAQFVIRLRRDVYHLRSYLEGPAQDALLAVLPLLRKTNDKLRCNFALSFVN